MLKKNRLIFILSGIVILTMVLFTLNKFVFNKDIQLKKEKAGNINILLLGIVGGTHEGPDLTDTIIFASINPGKNRAALISVPRDLWVPDIKGKINLAYHLGQGKNKQGKLYAKAVVEKVIGQNIDYVVVIDFSGFVKLIDYLGGIDVSVANTLDDYSYPIEGKETDSCGHSDDEIKQFIATVSAEMDQWVYFACRYKHLHVDAGTIHMNGEMALEFSRSRHGAGGEGSDFARSRRQQEVISAIREKTLSLGIILNPVKVIGVFNILKDNIDTDAQLTEFDDFINLARKMQAAKIQSFVVDFGNEEQKRYGLLQEALPSVDKRFQYNLIPRVGEGNFLEIHSYVQCVVSGLVCSVGKQGIQALTPTPQVSR